MFLEYVVVNIHISRPVTVCIQDRKYWHKSWSQDDKERREIPKGYSYSEIKNKLTIRNSFECQWKAEDKPTMCRFI